MKKFTASYILLFISPFVSYLMIFTNGIDAPASLPRAVFITMLSAIVGFFAFSFDLTAFFLRLSACKELAPQNPGFLRLRKNYIWLFVYKVFMALLSAFFLGLVINPLFRSMGREGTLTLAHVIVYMVVTDLIFRAGTVFTLWVEYGLLKNMRELGQGRKIGHRALRSVWYANILFAVAGVAHGLFTCADEVRAMFDRFNGEANVDMLTEVPDYSIPTPTVWGVIGWAVSIAFIVCLIRVTVKLGRVEETEAQTPRPDSLDAFYALRDSRDSV